MCPEWTLLHWLPIPDSNRRPSFSRRSSATELIGITPHSGVRAPVASPPFGPRNTTRRVSFPYRVLDRAPERRLLTGTPEPCARALARKARTAAHYPLPFTVDDVVSRVAPPRGLSRACIPGRSRCVSRATSAHRLAAIPAGLANEDKRAGPAWVDRARGLGGTPWVTPLSRRYRRISAPGRKSPRRPKPRR